MIDNVTVLAPALKHCVTHSNIIIWQSFKEACRALLFVNNTKCVAAITYLVK